MAKEVCGVADETGELDDDESKIDIDEEIAEALEIESEGEKEKETEAEDEEIEEGIAAKGIKSPKKPTQAQIDEHELTHWPFRDWCVHCVKGKTQNNPHRKAKDKNKED